MTPLPPSPLYFDWHLDVLDRIRERWRSNANRPTLLWGGHGMGKTYILDRLLAGGRSHSMPTPNKEEIRIDGSAKGPAQEEIIKGAWIAYELIQIDNVDRLFEPSASDTLESMSKVLRKLADGTLASSKRVVLTTTITLSTLYERENLLRGLGPAAREAWGQGFAQILSDYFRQLDLEELHPWRDDWEADFRTNFADYWRANLSLPPGELPAYLSDWMDVILDLTGRHPALVSAALDLLERLVIAQSASREASPISSTPISSGPRVPTFLANLVNPDSTDPPEKRQSAIRQAVEDRLLGPGGPMRALRSSLREWRALREERRMARALEALERIAAAGDRGLPYIDLHNTETREILQVGSDLCYLNDEGNYVVPGELLRREILGSVVRISLDPHRDHPAEEGNLKLHERGEIKTAAFSGAPWRVLWFLYNHRAENRFWPLEHLDTVAGSASERAAQNAIQRIQHKLSTTRKGLEECIVNRRGEGYRFTAITALD